MPWSVAGKHSISFADSVEEHHEQSLYFQNV